MYGTGLGYFSIFAPAGQHFSGLEFIVGTGGIDPNGDVYTTTEVVFQAFLDAVSVGSGMTTLSNGTVVGFSSPTGFTELRYTDTGLRLRDGEHTPAFDEVRAQFLAATTVPEPASYVLFATGLVAVLGAVRRRGKAANAA
ncbi:MAG: PEP-CTERM sorting domain-containing protein [Gemmatimonadota bacterium]|nr:PEP-CTERM sorting domain-containing protein [Gemmatimonadota bacterium]